MNSIKIRLLKLAFWLFIFHPNFAAAQRISIEPTFHFGTVVRHTPKINIQTGQPVFGQEIQIRLQTLGKQDWQILQRHPLFGLSFCHFHLGDGAHGDAFSFTPTLSVPLFRSEKWRGFFRFGSGIGWVTKPYHFLKNPTQNAIGSHVNNTFQANFSTEFRATQNIRAATGFSFNHFSNGSAALPNYGANIPTGYFSMIWTPKGDPVFEKKQVSKKAEGRKLGGLIYGGAAWVEYIILDGPRYPIWMGTAAATWKINKINRAMLGMDYEFNKSVFEWGFHAVTFPERNQAKLAATRLAIFGGDEFLFGSFGVQLQVGFYTGNRRINQYVLTDYYSKLVMRGYFPKIRGTSIRPHLGVYLKAHKVIAEYISINGGFEF